MCSAQHRSRRLPVAIAALALAGGVVHAQPGQPLDNEFVVNDSAAGAQRKPDVAAADDGRFVVVWEGIGPGDVDGGIFFRRFLADGTAQDATDQLANTSTVGIQSNPATAMDADGNFIIAWDTAGGGQISAREFQADGTPVTGTEFIVALGPTERDPDVATTGTSNFLVAWVSGTGNVDIVAERYLGGSPQGMIGLNNTVENQAEPAVAMDATGSNFVVAWVEPRAGGGSDIEYVLNPTGNEVGQVVNDNPGDGNTRASPTVAMDADGDFVLAWDGPGPADANGIVMRRFRADGSARDVTEIQVNTVTAGSQRAPDVTLDDDGDLVIAFATFGVDDLDVAYRRYGNDLSEQGQQQPAHAASIANQDLPAVASDATGNFVIAWQDDAADGNLEGVVARRFEGPAAGGAVQTPGTSIVVETTARGTALGTGPLTLALAALSLLLARLARLARVGPT